MIDEVDVSSENVIASHRMTKIGPDAKIFDFVANLRPNSLETSEWNLDFSFPGQRFERRLHCFREVFTKVSVRSGVGARTSGRLVDSKDRSAVVLETSRKYFGGTARENICYDNDRAGV